MEKVHQSVPLPSQQPPLPLITKLVKRSAKFSFLVKTSLSTSAQVPHDQIINFEGTLVYSNGIPVCLRNQKLVLGILQPTLGKRYFICKTNYLIKFRVSKQINGAEKNLIISLWHQNIEKAPVYQKMLGMLEETWGNLRVFLSKIGVTGSIKDRDRLKQILISQDIRNQLKNLLFRHQNAYQPNKQNSSKAFLCRQPTSYEKEESRKKYAVFVGKQEINIGSEISTQDSQNRDCCMKQFRNKQSDFLKYLPVNSPIVKLKKLKIFIDDGKSRESGCGGYFTVKKYEARAILPKIYGGINTIQIERNDLCETTLVESQIPLTIAVKHLNKELENDSRSDAKATRQMRIVKCIQSDQYVAKYYECEDQILTEGVGSEVIDCDWRKCVIMEKLELSLKDIKTKDLYCNWYMILKELTKGVISINRSGIAHRDIKPANVMFNSKGQLKIIDFSESIECWKELNLQNPSSTQKIGFTFPYSPMECSKLCVQGYANLRIDNWSVGMTICELLLGNLPVCSSKSLKAMIKEKWMGEDFHWCLNMRMADYGAKLEGCLRILCLRLMDQDWKKRLCLDSFLQFLDFCQRTYLIV